MGEWRVGKGMVRCVEEWIGRWVEALIDQYAGIYTIPSLYWCQGNSIVKDSQKFSPPHRRHVHNQSYT